MRFKIVREGFVCVRLARDDSFQPSAHQVVADHNIALCVAWLSSLNKEQLQQNERHANACVATRDADRSAERDYMYSQTSWHREKLCAKRCAAFLEEDERGALGMTMCLYFLGTASDGEVVRA